ncbi:sporulation-delaying protein SdpB family protein [Corallococcus sp. AB045]|uniref:sporulation-delaying protein SdpB family protein n=1 Tax=Corallococcus sp. AB045 TaxID=2316719 RepID=UPI0013156F69|nr:sporulation-delaying protein SdpB family protein [Corallococcus sp. AB045]
MLSRLGSWVRSSLEQPLHSNVVGLARSCIALGMLGTLLFTSPADLFLVAVDVPNASHCGGPARMGLFCFAGVAYLEVARWLAILVLALVASGWRPRVTGVLHWYVAMSFFTASKVVDGGDQAATVLSFLLIPVTLTDSRRWHWDPPALNEQGLSTPGGTLASLSARFVALTCLWAIRIQVAGIYFHAGVSKMKVAEWRDGTAVYYWFTDPWFGFAEPVRTLVMPLLTNGMVITLMTWGSLLLEMMLFAGVLATRRARAVLLVLGISFHAAIALVHGLLGFALVMFGALILFLRPVDMPFALPRLALKWPPIPGFTSRSSLQ